MQEKYFPLTHTILKVRKIYVFYGNFTQMLVLMVFILLLQIYSTLEGSIDQDFTVQTTSTDSSLSGFGTES